MIPKIGKRLILTENRDTLCLFLPENTNRSVMIFWSGLNTRWIILFLQTWETRMVSTTLRFTNTLETTKILLMLM